MTLTLLHGYLELTSCQSPKPGTGQSPRSGFSVLIPCDEVQDKFTLKFPGPAQHRRLVVFHNICGPTTKPC